jgi:predicted transcriptional regulator
MASLEPAGAGSAQAKNSTRTKNMVLRLDPDLAELLATVAEVEGRSVSDVAREAIAALVEARRTDKRFRRLLEDNLARHQRLLELLQDDQP